MSGGKGKLIVEIAAGLASAVGVTVALIRPWIREITSRRRLKLELVNSLGDRTTMTARNIKGEAEVYYYYLKVRNRRPSMPAKNVRVVITGRSEPDGPAGFTEIPVMIPIQLTWCFPRQNPTRITISKAEFCDIGFMKTPDGATPYFHLSTYLEQTPRNFRLQAVPNESLRLKIEAHADDCSSDPLILEITNLNRFSKDGLEIKQVRSLI
jgi:hypothetical protein